MKIADGLTDDVVLRLIGERLAQRRIGKNLTQKQVADEAGLGLRTVQRLELGAAATQLSGFVRVCRVLGLMDRFDELIPEQGPGPMELLKLKGKKRQRVRHGKTAPNAVKIWTWGDQQ
jgi:transcriptional regulator with XRE-family HTH domain